MSVPVVSTESLSKWYGQVIGLNDVSVEIPSGIVGLLERVWALRDNLSAYDATYVAVAEALNCPLLTADARLARAPGPECPITVVTD